MVFVRLTKPAEGSSASVVCVWYRACTFKYRWREQYSYLYKHRDLLGHGMCRLAAGFDRYLDLAKVLFRPYNGNVVEYRTYITSAGISVL